MPSIYSKVEVLQGGEICLKQMDKLKYQVFCSSVRGLLKKATVNYIELFSLLFVCLLYFAAH